MNRLLAKLRPAEREERANGAQLRPSIGSETDRRRGYVLTAAETTPCTCPEFCERDHGNE